MIRPGHRYEVLERGVAATFPHGKVPLDPGTIMTCIDIDDEGPIWGDEDGREFSIRFRINAPENVFCRLD